MLTLGITLRRRVSTFRGGRRREAQQLADCVAPIAPNADALGVRRRVSSGTGAALPADDCQALQSADPLGVDFQQRDDVPAYDREQSQA